MYSIANCAASSAAAPKGDDMQEAINVGSGRWVLAALVLGGFLVGTRSALAGPCTVAIERIETALDELTSTENGSAVHQSLSAQLHRQPSPRSVAQGQKQANDDELHHRAALKRARAADADRDELACLKALPDVRHEFIMR